MCAWVGRSWPTYPGICWLAGTHGALNIRHLTDVSHCKLHQYLCCNHEIKCQHRSHRGWPQGDMAPPGSADTSLVRKQMDTMAPTRPTELQESTSPQTCKSRPAR